MIIKRIIFTWISIKVFINMEEIGYLVKINLFSDKSLESYYRFIIQIEISNFKYTNYF